MFFKLFSSHLALVAVVVAGLGFYSVDGIQRAYLSSLERGLEDQAIILADAIAPEMAQGGQLDPVLALFDERTSVRAIVVNRSGTLLASSEPEFTALIGSRVSADGLEQALAGETYGTVLPGTVELVYVVTPVSYRGELVGAVRVSYTILELREQIESLVNGLLLGLAGATLASVVLASALAYRLSRPARILAEAAHGVAEGDLTRRTGVRGGDEMARAAQAFDEMAERLQQLQAQRQQLLTSVSHEIHSTITGMAMATEVLGSGMALPESSRERLLSGLSTHVQRLKRLADDLLESARLSRGAFTLQLAEVRPEALVSGTIAAFAADAVLRAVRLEQQVAPDLPPLRGDQDRLGQALGNLVENALRHTPAGGAVVVTAERVEDRCVLRVTDQGPGPAAPLRKEAPGSQGRLGLGLTIVTGLVEAHGGRFSISPAAGGGTVCEISLPLALAPVAVASP